MKVRFFTVAAAIMLMGFGLLAQKNVQTINYDGGYSKIVTPPGYETKKISDNNFVSTKIVPPEIASRIKDRDDETCTVTIDIQQDDWGTVWIEYPLSEDYIFSESFRHGNPEWGEIEGNTFDVQIPKGVYIDVIAHGQFSQEDYRIKIFALDQIFIDKKEIVTIDFDESINHISFNCVDQNNTLISDLDLLHYEPMSFFSTYGGNYLIIIGAPFNEVYDSDIYFNNMGSRNGFITDFKCYTSTGDWYYFSYILTDGITENIIVENTSDDLTHYLQFLNINKEPERNSTSLLGVWYYFYERQFDGYYYTQVFGFNDGDTHDREKPISVYTNAKINDNPQPGDFNTVLFPIYYDDDDWYFDDDLWQPEEETAIWSAPFNINNNGQIVLHSYLHGEAGNMYFPENYVELITDDPLSVIYESEELITNNFRTPQLYFQFIGETPSIYPWVDYAYFMGRIVFMGENGERRYIDKNADVNVKVNGASIYDDCLWKFQNYQDYVDIGVVEMKISNENVKGYGKTLTNNTEITFDLAKEDPYPPTVTLLRVINQNDEITVTINDPTNSKLLIAAGDFGNVYDEWTGEMVLPTKYMRKPNIEIQYTVDNETFYPLEAVEDESLFHVAYGNIFNVNLAPLKTAGINEQWITVVITLTDEVGNKQKQTLSSLFYCGKNLGIEGKNIISGKTIVFPNPFTDKVTIQTEKPLTGETYFEIYDINGRIVYQKIINANQTTSFNWNGSFVKEGVYFYGIYNQGNVISGKIVKE